MYVIDVISTFGQFVRMHSVILSGWIRTICPDAFGYFVRMDSVILSGWTYPTLPVAIITRIWLYHGRTHLFYFRSFKSPIAVFLHRFFWRRRKFLRCVLLSVSISSLAIGYLISIMWTRRRRLCFSVSCIQHKKTIDYFYRHSPMAYRHSIPV